MLFKAGLKSSASASAAVVAASAVIIAASAAVIAASASAAVVGKTVSVASAAREQKNKNDDPEAVITAHKSVPP